MTIKKQNVLFFDLDGTLVDSVPDLTLAVNQTLSDLNGKQFEQSVIRSWVGNGARVLVERALTHSAGVAPSAEQLNQALVLFMTHYEQCLCLNSQLFEGVRNSLELLKTRGYRLGVITNKPERFVRPILKGLEVNHLFELVVGGDTVEKRKPHPLPIHHACEQLAVMHEVCIMIGDSKNDILAAKAANITSIGLTYGYNYGEDIAVNGPDWVVDNFSDLLTILNSEN